MIPLPRPLRWLALLLLVTPRLSAGDDPPGFVIQNDPVPSPASAPAFAPVLLPADAPHAPDALRLGWLQTSPTRPVPHAAVLDRLNRRWTPSASPPELSAASASSPAAPAPAPASGNGFVFHARGSYLAAAWFSPDPEPALYVATSANAGDTWLAPVRVDDRAPAGHPAIVLLDDGSQLVAWLERAADGWVILLRRVSPAGLLSVPVRLATLPEDAPPERLLLGRVKDADTTPAQLLLVYAQPGPPPALVPRLITLPDPTLLYEADACGCEPRTGEQRGHAFKGRILSLDTLSGTVQIAHEPIPGVMPGRTTTFRAAPEVLSALVPGRGVLARIEQLGPDWWVSAPRLLLPLDEPQPLRGSEPGSDR